MEDRQVSMSDKGYVLCYHAGYLAWGDNETMDRKSPGGHGMSLEEGVWEWRSEQAKGLEDLFSFPFTSVTDIFLPH